MSGPSRPDVQRAPRVASDGMLHYGFGGARQAQPEPFIILPGDQAPDARMGPDGLPLPPSDLAGIGGACCLGCALRPLSQVCPDCPRRDAVRQRAAGRARLAAAEAARHAKPRRPWWARLLRRSGP